LIGKTANAIRSLNQAFENRTIRKIYNAVVIGSTPLTGEINLPIDNSPAQSHYQKLAEVPSPRFGVLSLLELRPQSGKRHQLRKHLALIGHPILGDREYSPPKMLLQGKGLYLHASTLQFQHPFSGLTLTIESPIPKKFKKIFTGV
jgi:23S rRNA pseudouridine1911/1915/1917 synthase